MAPQPISPTSQPSMVPPRTPPSLVGKDGSGRPLHGSESSLPTAVMSQPTRISRSLSDSWQTMMPTEDNQRSKSLPSSPNRPATAVGMMAMGLAMPMGMGMPMGMPPMAMGMAVGGVVGEPAAAAAGAVGVGAVPIGVGPVGAGTVAAPEQITLQPLPLGRSSLVGMASEFGDERSHESPVPSAPMGLRPKTGPTTFYGRHHQQDSPDDNLMPAWIGFKNETPLSGRSTPKGSRFTSSLFHHPSFDARMADSMMIDMLHEEIGQFVSYVSSLTQVKTLQQQKLLQRIQAIVERIWAGARVDPYGSFATGLSIPSSDLDLVVSGFRINSYDKHHWSDLPVSLSPLQTLAAALKKQGWLKRMQCIETASVPVIKIVAEIAGEFLHVDISFDTPAAPIPPVVMSSTQVVAAGGAVSSTAMTSDHQPAFSFLGRASQSSSSLRTSIGASLGMSTTSPVMPGADGHDKHRGRQAVELVRSYVARYPALRPLTVVLKQFLAERALNNVYSGGLSSYCLVLIVVSFFENNMHPGDPLDNVGMLLIDLLDFFGTQFDFHRMGISLRTPSHPGGFFYLQVPCPTLVLLDPFNPKNNIGKNVFAMYRIKAAFHYALTRLRAPYPPRFAPTLLSRIIHGPPRLRVSAHQVRPGSTASSSTVD